MRLVSESLCKIYRRFINTNAPDRVEVCTEKERANLMLSNNYIFGEYIRSIRSYIVSIHRRYVKEIVCIIKKGDPNLN